MRLNSPLPDSGVKVPLWATFTGWRGVPILALGSNNFAPLLRLHEDRVEFKVFRTHTRPLGDIERIDARRLGKTNQITIEWRGENFTLSANVLTPRLLLQVLEFFARKGIALSDAARALMESP